MYEHTASEAKKKVTAKAETAEISARMKIPIRYPNVSIRVRGRDGRSNAGLSTGRAFICRLPRADGRTRVRALPNFDIVCLPGRIVPGGENGRIYSN